VDKLIHITIAKYFISDGAGSLYPTEQEKNIYVTFLED
jgi:hypothetical protein